MKKLVLIISIIMLVLSGCRLSDAEKLRQPGIVEHEALSILEENNQLSRNDLTLALISAIRSEDLNIQLVKKLIEISADISAKSKHNFSPLMFAVLADKKEVVQLLLSYDVDIERFETFDGMNSLMLAVDMKKLDIVEVLLKSGANPYSKSPVKGISAADLARNKGFDEIYNLLSSNQRDE